MSIINDFNIRSIPKHQAKDWIIKKHYAHTMPANLMYSFGLYDNSNILSGVCCYGTPANNHNNELGGFNMIELVRLVKNDDLPQNTLSYFVSQTFQHLPKPIAIISYADQGKNHHGYIYQATNWIYTGLGGGVDFYLSSDGREIHSRIMSDLRKESPLMSRSEIAEKNKWSLMKGTYKYRYFYFLGSKSEKRSMKRALLEKYKIVPYPKGQNQNYNADYEISPQGVLF